jgi:branched-chain amino acid transport system ATP-binding protein
MAGAGPSLVHQVLRTVTGLGGDAIDVGRGAAAGPIFAVEAITKAHGGVVALDDVTLAVGPAEVLGVIGTNGAGKTTLFDVCSGFVRPSAGRVLLAGQDVTHLSPQRRAVLGLGRVFQDVRLWSTLSVADALATALDRHLAVRDPLAESFGLVATADAEADVRDRVDQLLHTFGLARFAHRAVNELSSGMRRVTELACALAADPVVLLLDEPTAGVAQREAGALGELILGLRDDTGAAFVVIEHDVPLVASVADRVACLHVGRVIAHGPTGDVLADPAVLAAYLAAEDPAEVVGAMGRSRPAERPGSAGGGESAGGAGSDGGARPVGDGGPADRGRVVPGGRPSAAWGTAAQPGLDPSGAAPRSVDRTLVDSGRPS